MTGKCKDDTEMLVSGKLRGSLNNKTLKFKQSNLLDKVRFKERCYYHREQKENNTNRTVKLHIFSCQGV